jgi:hypothetical protein
MPTIRMRGIKNYPRKEITQRKIDQWNEFCWEATTWIFVASALLMVFIHAIK